MEGKTQFDELVGEWQVNGSPLIRWRRPVTNEVTLLIRYLL
jgi:hypothetical protein